jgi:hypothetical protein
MDALPQVAAVLGSVKAAFDIAIAIGDTIAPAKLKAQFSELLNHLIAAQAAVLEIQQESLAIQAENHDLKHQIVKLKDWNEQKLDYHLASLAGGSLLYSYCPRSDATEPPHYLCPNCHGNDKKSILQPQLHSATPCLKCHACHATFPLPPIGIRQARLER